MKIGLLICDHVLPQNQAKFGDYPAMFAQLFPEFDFQLYEVSKGHFPENLEECDGYMATGSHHSVYEDLDWIATLKDIIRSIYEQQKYFIGFCFGHQLMGEALGGRVEKSPAGWCVGVHEFEITQVQNWMKPVQEKINLLMMCQDQVVTLPKDSLLLAGNGQCSIGMFQVGSRMLGIQAHPEFSKGYDRLLMEKRVNEMGLEVVERGLASLSLPVDAAVFREWVRNFIAST